MAIIPEGQKILTSAPEVNTTYGGPDSLKALNTWYTMQDIANTVQPYKVFTALLKQSGGNDPQYQQSGLLTVGVTYYIDDNASYPDFTNVGAPNNNIGTYFIATGTTPNSWAEASLAYNTGAPVATVLENTIGNIWFIYNGVGAYAINSNSLFTSNKTYIDTKNIFGNGASQNIFEDVEESNSNSYQFFNLVELQTNPVTIDGIDRGRIEIRVYN